MIARGWFANTSGIPSTHSTVGIFGINWFDKQSISRVRGEQQMKNVLPYKRSRYNGLENRNTEV